MCQLTVIDVADGVDKDYLHTLLMLNTLDNNFDGFGYYKFEGKKYFKTQMDFIEFYKADGEVSEKFRNNTDINGLYHVRLASVNKNNISKDGAHPHVLGNIVLMHNGTLTKLYHKTLNHILSFYESDPDVDTDSILFLRALHYFSYGEGSGDIKSVTEESIKSAVNLFNGTFVFLIIDTNNPSRIFIAKDEKTKPLYMGTLFKNEKPVGVVFNSKWYMLESAFNIANTIMKKSDVTLDIAEVKGNTIYTYDLGTYSLTKVCNFPFSHVPPELDKVVAKNNTTSIMSRRNPARNSADKVLYLSQVFTDIIDNTLLGLDDIISIFEMVYGIPILHYNSNLEILEDFKTLLETLKGITTKEKDMLYSQMLAIDGIGLKKPKIYTHSNLEFPYMLNSIEELTNAKELLYANTSEIQ